jgi:hypothetical protein
MEPLHILYQLDAKLKHIYLPQKLFVHLKNFTNAHAQLLHNNKVGFLFEKKLGIVVICYANVKQCWESLKLKHVDIKQYLNLLLVIFIVVVFLRDINELDDDRLLFVNLLFGNIIKNSIVYLTEAP